MPQGIEIVPLSAADSVDAARSWYESSYPINNAVGISNKTTTLGVNSSNSAAFDLSQYIKPDWKHTSKYKRFGKDVIEMPVDPGKVLYYGLKNGNTGQQISAKENSRAWFLLFNDGKQYTAYVMVLIGDPSYISGDPSKLTNNSYRKRDANFSGVLVYFTPSGKFIRSYKYVNGSIATSNSQTATASAKQTQSTGKTTNELAACIDWYETFWDEDGNVMFEEYLYTTCTDNVTYGGGGGYNPCQVANSVAAKQAINVVQNPDPTTDDGSGDGGMPDPTQPTPCSDPSVDPTAQYQLDSLLSSDSGYKDYYGKMNDAERALALRHPIDAYHVYQNANFCLQETVNVWPGLSEHNDDGDAFRHTLWNVMNTTLLGADEARLFADAHESDPNNPPLEKAMDLNNNQVGRDDQIYFAANNITSQSAKESYIVNQILNGGQLIIENGQLVKSH